MTELIIYHRPFRAILAAETTPEEFLASGSSWTTTLKNNINTTYNDSFNSIVRQSSGGSGGLRLDVESDISIPTTYTILDVREPEKRKTNWSKTVTIPGTKNNNRIFSHIYELSSDGWITIGNNSTYEGFNPNLRLECILLNDGIQTLKGNLQLKRISKDVVGNIQYEVTLSGDLTSLFYDVGSAKLSDLDFSEWTHRWTKENIELSWKGITLKNGAQFTTTTTTGSKDINRIFKGSNGRLTIRTNGVHNLSEGFWVNITPITTAFSEFLSIAGEWQVSDIISSTDFCVNYFYPISLRESGYTAPVRGAFGTITKRTSSGSGYVYPMISWGDEYDYNSFPVTSFVPGVYVKEILDKIFVETKSTYESDFFESEFFKRLILVQKKESYQLNPSEVKERKFWVGTTQSYLTGASYRGPGNWYWSQVGTTSTATASIFPSETPKKFPFASESGSFGTVSFYDNGLVSSTTQYGNWDNVTYKWNVPESGEYDLTALIKLDAWCDMNGFGTTPGTGTSSFNLTTYRYYPGAGGQTYNNAYTSGPGPYSSIDPFTFGMQVRATIKRLRDGVTTNIGQNVCDFLMNNQSYYSKDNTNWDYFGRYRPLNWRNQQVQVSSSSKYFKRGDVVWVELDQYIQSPSGSPVSFTTLGRKTAFSFNQSGGNEIARAILGEWYLRVNSQSYVFNSPSAIVVEGGVIPMTSVLPKDMECKDFLLGIIKMFNLHITDDASVDRKYYIEPRDQFYKTGATSSDFVDWSDKIDNTSVEMTPLGELIAKYYVFSNREENDYWNKKFKDDRGRPYSYYKKEINNDFLKNETNISIPFGTSVMINNPVGSDVVMPAILQVEQNGSFKPVSTSAPRVLIWGGMRPYTAQRGGSQINLENAALPNRFGWEMLSNSQPVSFTQTGNVTYLTLGSTSSQYNQYPYAGTVDSAQDPLIDINWYNMEVDDFVYYDFARWTNSNLYNKYWSNFINEISDPTSKVVSVSVNLSPTDIHNLDFRKIYVIDGIYLRLQKIIDYDANSKSLTKCEFLKLKSPIRYQPRSIIVDSYGSVATDFVTTTDTTRPVEYISVEKAPDRKRPQFGFNNSTTGVNLSNNISVVTTGLSNFVGPNSKNITITGNENSVGDGAQNIQISGGSGNFVMGGVKNVNIIGTDKKYISESNVTYINGVRYVNGIPVSKANVINGSVDYVTIKQSSTTTPNVINSGEDVVIYTGSSAFENIINSGKDSILPDLPELGISTVVNPNPRTNLSSGFETNIATASYVDTIRRRAELR